VIENRYSPPSFEIHSSVPHKAKEVQASKVKVGRELPDCGFEYVKNHTASRVTKPDPPLNLPRGIRYNMASGNVEKYPNWKSSEKWGWDKR